MLLTPPSARLLSLLGTIAALAPLAHAQCTPAFSTFGGGAWSGLAPAAMVQWDPDGPGPLPTMLVAAGQFTQAGGVTVNNIAQWDGAHWHALLPGFPGIKALAVYNGELIAGGTFTSINGAPINRIARWDGAAWQPLGSGLTGGTSSPACYALTTFDGDLIAGGAFSTAGGVPCRSIARWNGSTWQPIGTALPQFSSVYAVAQVGRELVVGGNQLTNQAQINSEVLAWDGQSWITFPIGSGWGNPGEGDQRIQVILDMGDAQFAVGRYAGTNDPLYTFNTLAWLPLGTFPSGFTERPNVTSLSMFNGDLYAAGTFHGVGGGMAIGNIARWGVDGVWHPVPTAGSVFPVSALATFEGRLIVATDEAYDGVDVRGVAAWDGSHFNGLMDGLDGEVAALAAVGGDVILAGGFRNHGTTTLNCIARFDGSNLTTLGSGLGGAGRAIAFSGTSMYVGGDFTSAGGVGANHVARWDGDWHAVGGGTNGPVYAMTFYNGDLIAAGPFTSAGGAPASYIARWDGAAWQPMGAGFDSFVYHLWVHGGKLIAGGLFTASGALSLAHVAQWDGSSWQPMGAGVDQSVSSLSSYDGELIAGGAFTTADGNPALHVAAWNGVSWRPLASGTPGTTTGLGVYDGRLFAASLVPPSPATTVAVTSWDGSSWRNEASASGALPSIAALTAVGDQLYMGGYFFAVQGQTTNSLAALTESCGPVCGSSDFNHDGDAATDADIEAFIACLAGNCCPYCGSADFNSDGDSATDADIEAFFRVLAGGSC